MPKLSVGCAIDGCSREHYARGWCNLHYSRWWRQGDPLFGEPIQLTEKRCVGCGETKPLDEFYVSKRHTGGRSYYCRPCATAKRREYYERTSNETTRAEAARRTREYMSDPENAARDRKRALAWAKAHPDVVNKRNAEWRRQNPEKTREIARRQRQKNPEVGRAHVERRRARLANAPVNDFTVADWQAVQADFAGECAYCHRTDVPLQQEHMTPLSRHGGHTRSNIVPSCGPCNMRKGTKTILEFMKAGV